MIEGIEKRGNVAVVFLAGNLEIGKQSRFKDELVRQLPVENSRVVVDFKSVSFIDSSCLGVLVSLARKLRQGTGDLRICSLQQEVRSIFQITRMDKVFKLFDHLDDAVKSYSPP